MIDGCVRCLLKGRHRLARYLVEGRGKAEMVCDEHLDASLRWAGPGSTFRRYASGTPPSTVVDATPEQPTLF